MTRSRPHFTALTLLILLISMSGSPLAVSLAAQDTPLSAPHSPDWMVVTQVFQGAETAPAETHEIAFRDGIYYDFPTDPQQPWTIFDLPAARVILLDRAAQTRTSVPTEDLIKLAARVEAQITDAVHRERYGMDAAATQTGQLRFAVKYTDMQYDVEAVQAPEAVVALQYGRFVDWVCRLNIARPRGVPPFARMKLNALMTSHRVVPRETFVTMTRHLGAQRTPATIRLRSTTLIHRDIEARVDAQIKEAQTLRIVYKEIPWDQYEH